VVQETLPSKLTHNLLISPEDTLFQKLLVKIVKMKPNTNTEISKVHGKDGLEDVETLLVLPLTTFT